MMQCKVMDLESIVVVDLCTRKLNRTPFWSFIYLSHLLYKCYFKKCVIIFLSISQFVANTKFGDEDSLIYISSFSENTKDNNYTLIVTADMKPQLLHFIGFDRLFGSHYDEYDIMYDQVTFAKPDPISFVVLSSMWISTHTSPSSCSILFH